MLFLLPSQAATIMDQTYTASFLKNNALFPTRTATLTATTPAKIEFGTGSAFDRMMQYQIVSAGNFSTSYEYLIKLTVYGFEALTSDSDFTVGIFDGTNTIGFCNSDDANNQNYFFENNTYIATTNPAMANYPSIATFQANLLLNATTTVTGIAGSATETRVSGLVLDRSAALSLVLVANDAAERYRFESIRVEIESAVPELSTLYLLFTGAILFFLRKNLLLR